MPAPTPMEKANAMEHLMRGLDAASLLTISKNGVPFMAKITDRPMNCPDGTACSAPFDSDQLLRIELGPNAKATAESEAQQGLFVQVKQYVAKKLQQLMDISK